ncbi:MAG TPA: hypothetical protein VIN61_09095 [Gammaproteobacteria bacterium]
MGGRGPRSSASALREQLAQEAARLMMEGGIEDYGLAKRKAAERLGVRSAGALPSNAQIASSLTERQRIFAPDAHARRLVTLRRLAAEVMEWLAPFDPRLVGAVLTGTVTINSAIELHVYTDAPELVAAVLEQQRVPVRDCQRRYRFNEQQKPVQVPGFSFQLDGEEVVVLAFAEKRSRQAPLSPVDQRPMRRAGRAEVLAMLDDGPQAGDPA